MHLLAFSSPGHKFFDRRVPTYTETEISKPYMDAALRLFLTFQYLFINTYFFGNNTNHKILLPCFYIKEDLPKKSMF